MDFNKLYRKIADLDKGRQVLNESEQPVEECGMMGMSPLGGMGMDERPTTMSVNMNASGADGIRELLTILQGKGDDAEMSEPDAGPAGAILSIGADEPEGELDLGLDGDLDMHDHGDDMGGDEEPDSKNPMFGREPDMDEEFANEPQEHMAAGFDRMTGTDGSGQGIDRPKKTFPKVAGGDNPMQQMSENLRYRLMNLYKEIKIR
jgi:hypothetical protein